MRALLITVACLVVFRPALAQVPAVAVEIPGCKIVQATAEVRRDQEIADYCERTVNGVSNGCTYVMRHADAREQNARDIGWVSQISLIHHFKGRGRPVLMPDGSMFVYISRACKIVSIVTPEGCTPRGKRQTCP